MFYSAQILAKKNGLGIVWIAAHMDGKLKKNNVFEANIAGSVGKIKFLASSIDHHSRFYLRLGVTSGDNSTMDNKFVQNMLILNINQRQLSDGPDSSQS